jgi:hypothetical protein
MKTTFMKMAAAFMVSALFLTTGANASDQDEMVPYFVSGILQKKDSPSVVQVIQAMVVSNSPANAQSEFTVLALVQFPDYIPVQVLASTFSKLYKSLPENQSKPNNPKGKGSNL